MKLTTTQANILQAAANRPSEDIEPLPSNVNAGVRQRVIDGLLNRKLIEFKDGIYCINAHTAEILFVALRLALLLVLPVPLVLLVVLVLLVAI